MELCNGCIHKKVCRYVGKEEPQKLPAPFEITCVEYSPLKEKFVLGCGSTATTATKPY